MRKSSALGTNVLLRSLFQTLFREIYFKGNGLEGVDWINLAQNKYVWWALVDKVMKHSSSIKSKHFSEYPSDY